MYIDIYTYTHTHACKHTKTLQTVSLYVARGRHKTSDVKWNWFILGYRQYTFNNNICISVANIETLSNLCRERHLFRVVISQTHSIHMHCIPFIPILRCCREPYKLIPNKRFV